MLSQKLQTACAFLLLRQIFYPCLSEFVLVCSLVRSERNEENPEGLVGVGGKQQTIFYETAGRARVWRG